MSKRVKNKNSRFLSENVASIPSGEDRYQSNRSVILTERMIINPFFLLISHPDSRGKETLNLTPFPSSQAYSFPAFSTTPRLMLVSLEIQGHR